MSAVVKWTFEDYWLGQEQATSYRATGFAQEFTVPATVEQVEVTLRGAPGGGSAQGRARGGYVHGFIDVTPGEKLGIFVGTEGQSRDGADGGAGGFNGGGNGGDTGSLSSIVAPRIGGGNGGGGGTDIRRNGADGTLADRVAVAGGGGGNNGVDAAIIVGDNVTDTLKPGGAITYASYLQSRNAVYQVRFVSGSMRIFEGATQIWDSATDTAGHIADGTGFRAVLQGDGNFVIYNSGGTALWATKTRTGVRLVMQNDGNLVLYSTGSAVWTSGTARNFATPAYVLGPGRPGGNPVGLVSPDGTGYDGTSTGGGESGNGFVTGHPGTLGHGGNGTAVDFNVDDPGMGGGGGGYYGGGSGSGTTDILNYYGWGGGGGSSYIGGLINSTEFPTVALPGQFLPDSQADEPLVTITYTQLGLKYMFEINPNDGGTPTISKNISMTQNVGPNRVNILQEGQNQAPLMAISGVILTQKQLEALETWYDRRVFIKMTDDLNREFYGVFSKFNPQRKRKASNPWYHTWDAEFTVSAYRNASGNWVYGRLA